MARKPRVHYTLNPGDYLSFPKEDIRAIIRGADEMISSGGRTLLGKLLKGSKDKKVLALGLDKSPVYGYFSSHTLKDIGERVDWVIDRDLLRIEYDGSLPLLVHSPDGWEVCKDIWAHEIKATFDKQLKTQQRPYNMEYLKDRNRQMITTVIEGIAASGEAKYIPILQDWAAIEYKKVRQLINRAIKELG